ncbi:hypothetical protein [Brevibacillus parabrevis]|uniref:hypothetical protein n=1 Tax=Brevibacillus parabrevis TaxID=54914 RepID=UPI001F6252F8|nr:hypothetical protein [Brevibacillus parabrevis]MDR4999720.1 hypothetical protein [Brevibacillus parabrevis]
MSVRNDIANFIKYPKETMWLVVLVIIVLTGFGSFSKGKETVETISLEAHYITYNSAEELDKADLILIGTPIADFSEREHQTSYYFDGSLEDFYTNTEIQVEKIIKSPNDFELDNSDTFSVIEPVGLVEMDGAKKVTIDGYREMKKGEKYIMFLNKNAYGKYSIINNDLGKFNLDENSTEINKFAKKSTELTLEDEVKIKYRDFIE